MGRCNFSMESIQRQSNDFFNALTDAVAKLRSSGDWSTASVKKSFIAQVIKEYTGLNIVLYVKEGWSMTIRLGHLTANHVFVDGATSNVASKIIDVTKTSLKGTIDTKNAKVSGVFCDVVSDIIIGTALFKPGKFNDAQIAACILHEVGHAFTYFQFMSTVAYGNLVVQQTINNVFMSNDYKTKQIHLKQAEEVLGLEKDVSIEDWVDTSKENLEVILITRFYRELKSRSDSIYYDVRNCEQLADTFVAKHGGAVALAEANHKLDKEYKLYGNANFFSHVLTQTASLVKQITVGSVTSREIILSMHQPKKYDDPKDRIAFLKFQLIDDLKQLPRGDAVSRKDIVDSIKDIDDILKTIHVRRDVLTYIHETMTTVGKSASHQQSQQKKLEEMLYNNLYYQSAKLKTLY